MENSESPEKRRKLDEFHDVPGSKSNQPHAMTLGERKRNGPRVLVNKLNINHDVIERLRRITKVCGKQMTADTVNSQGSGTGEMNESKASGNKNEGVVMNGSCNGNQQKESLAKEAKSKESADKDLITGLTSIQNGTKDVKSSSVENGTSEVNDDEMKKQTIADVQIFKQVLKEIIEQRTKIVEEAVAANSIHLQNRIQDLERENRELQWNARKVFGAFKKYVTENEKNKLSKTSRGIQVNTEMNFGTEVSASPVISVPRTNSVAKPTVKATTTGEMVNPRTPSMTSASSPNATYVAVASRSDPELRNLAQKSPLQQLPSQSRPNVQSHLQQTTRAVSASTAVVFTVTPRPAKPSVAQEGIKATENQIRHLQTRIAQLQPAIPKTYPQPQSLEHSKSSPGVPSQIQSPSQANSTLDRIRQNQEVLLQQRQLLQQQQQQQQQKQRFSQTSTPQAKQQYIIPSETTASLLHQLQRQQQLQQQQHYQRIGMQQQKSQERHLSAPSNQMRQPPVLASTIRSPDLSPQQKQQIQQHSVGPSSSQFSNSQQRNYTSSPSQNPMYSLEQLRQSHAQQNAVSNPPPSLVSSNARNPNNVNSTGKSQISAVSHATTLNQISLSTLSNYRSNLVNANTLVHEHINKLVNHSRGSQPSSPVQVTTGGQKGETLQRQETVSSANGSANGSYQRESTLPSEYRHSPNRIQSDVAQNHMGTATGREGPQLPNDVSTAEAPTCKQLQADIQSIQKSIVVPARNKHTEEDVLPSGYRFSLPSPEYLLQRQTLQQQQQQQPQSGNHPQHPQASQVSQAQSLQRFSSNERFPLSGGQSREPNEVVYTRQTPSTQMQTVQKETVLNQKSRDETVSQPVYRPIRPMPENWSQQQNHQEEQFQYGRQPQQIPPRLSQMQQQSLQEKQQAPSLTSEGGNHRMTLQSFRRPPIQSPGISSSDPPNDRHLQDAPKTSVPQSTTASHLSNSNPVMLAQGNIQKPLPKPSASIAVMGSGIVLSWNMEYDEASIKIDNYELFACQDVKETNGQPIKWKKIGIVKALPLPMACTLTQFSSGSKYFFSVRAVDENERAGTFSDPCTVSLNSS